MIDYPPIIRFGLLCAYIILAWRYRATITVLSNAMPWAVGVVIAITFGVICAITGAYQIGGPDAANMVIPFWLGLLGVVIATTFSISLFLFLVAMLGALVSGLWYLAHRRTEKKKVIPQTLGDYNRFAVPEDHAGREYYTSGHGKCYPVKSGEVHIALIQERYTRSELYQLARWLDVIYTDLSKPPLDDDDNPFIDLRYEDLRRGTNDL